ncbi:MAG: glycosyltransferase family 2 protein [Calditerrivibrio sp.]|nr:glycosyltransferase family 2 protein [Calditerrivibrio sp.]MCA1932764.1 glycosyltransferase family 2 protein [Calditerrivibrio sp.]MCA1980906.1 glycosyltransferase family 2 protein [Calditerrivibrio sp.]
MKCEDLPKVSLVIPSRNEEKHIGNFLDSLCRVNYPKHKLEIIFVDGKSEDNTKKIIEGYREKLLVSVIENEKKITPVALNIGIKNSSGDYIIILSSHTSINESFIMDNIETIIETKADCVGGVINTIPANNKLFAKTIAFVLSNRFGVGNSIFRTGADKIMETDTVPYGCYRRGVFDKFGYFNENLVRNQDIEFNLRIKNAGCKIILNPKIRSVYYPRETLKDLFKQNYQNGFWIFYSLKFAKLPFSYRHTIPSLFVLSILLGIFPFFRSISLLSLISYTVANVSFSFQIAKNNGFIYFVPSIISFWTLHLSYGIGSIWGGIKYLFGGKNG